MSWRTTADAGEFLAGAGHYLRADPVENTLLLTIAYAPMPVRAKVTASAGEATGECTSEAEWRVLYNKADAALYMAKADGRNCLRREAA